MLDWLTDDDGNINVDFIGKYENLEDDFGKICKMIGIPILSLSHTNTAEMRTGEPRKHYSYYYDDELKDIIAKLYKKDIDYFNYDFKTVI
jgi:hypothetical protein